MSLPDLLIFAEEFQRGVRGNTSEMKLEGIFTPPFVAYIYITLRYPRASLLAEFDILLYPPKSCTCHRRGARHRLELLLAHPQPSLAIQRRGVVQGGEPTIRI